MGRSLKCPDTIRGEARKEWDRVTAILRERGVLDQLDRGVLTCYCEQWGTRESASSQLNKMGLVVKTKNNNVIPNPLLGIRNTAAKMVEKFSRELGFSPMSRARRAKNGGGGGGVGGRDVLKDLDDD